MAIGPTILTKISHVCVLINSLQRHHETSSTNLHIFILVLILFRQVIAGRHWFRIPLFRWSDAIAQNERYLVNARDASWVNRIKIWELFTGPTCTLPLSLTVIPYVFRSYFRNKATVTSYCLTQCISKPPRSFEIHWTLLRLAMTSQWQKKTCLESPGRLGVRGEQRQVAPFEVPWQPAVASHACRDYFL